MRLPLAACLAWLCFGCTTSPTPGDEFAAGDQEALEACGEQVVASRELLIRALAVVEDPVRTRWSGHTLVGSDGAWQFGRLMSQMAGSKDPADFVLDWLQRWTREQYSNSQTVHFRHGMQAIIDAWPRRPGGKPDLTRAPFRLLAIVNRIDLRDLAQGSAGEGRFVFGVLDAEGQPSEFTVILEYRLPARSQAEVLAWAADWHELGQLSATSAAYRDKLQALTDRFTGKNAEPGRPNGSAISQIRTNEISLDVPWELRQFELSPKGGFLLLRPLTRTPDDRLNGSATLAAFINENEEAILDGSHTVPGLYAGAPFRAAAVRNRVDQWDAPGVDPEARRLFSLNTCDGCHGGDTATRFLHVHPRAEGQIAELSGFLTGETVNDPLDGTPRSFNDLERRSNDLKSLVCPTTRQAAALRPAMHRTH